MRERVFQPLGMTRTSMVWQSAFESDYANGYDGYGRSLVLTGAPRPTPPVRCRQRLAILRASSKLSCGENVLQKKTRELMLSPQIPILSKHQFPSLVFEPTDENKAIRLSYGLGWGLYWTPYGKAFFKEGHTEGWRNYAVCFDKKKLDY